MSVVLSQRDLDFLLYEWLNVEQLTGRERYRHHSAETFRGIMSLSRDVAEREFAPHNAASDADEPQFDGDRVTVNPHIAPALQAFADTGLFAATFDEEMGGGQLPHVIHRACFLWFQAANIATSSYPGLAMANANLLIAHGSPAQVRAFVPPMIEGRFMGTMCLSEPQAGSSLADVATRALRQPDGTYRLHGAKMWISGGDHELTENIVHLVLARVPGDPEGVKGLSLFIVPKRLLDVDGSVGERNDVTLAGINHKMGWRGTVNTFLKFGEGRYMPGGEAGAVGYLIGQRGHGLAYMFHMMNEARIGVGAGALALGYTSYLYAVDYAQTRKQGRTAGAERGGPVPIVRHLDVRRMLLASKSYVEGGLALVLFAARLLDERLTGDSERTRDEAALLLDVLTPIVKSWPSTWGLVANDHAIQVHGGYGYTRDYPVEQFYRDNRLNPIHEGTHGVQGLDLLGRKVMKHDGGALNLLLSRMRDACAVAPESLAGWADQLTQACARAEHTTGMLTDPAAPEGTVHANASMYLDALGHVVVAWLWLEQATVCHDRDTEPFYAGKMAAARYFFTYELPKTGPMFDLMDARDTLLADLAEESL